MPQDGGIRSDFVVEDREFLRRKKRSLMVKNRFPESVTVHVILIDCRVGNYDTNKGNYATYLGEARDVASCRPLVLAPGGRSLFIVAKGRDC